MQIRPCMYQDMTYFALQNGKDCLSKTPKNPKTKTSTR